MKRDNLIEQPHALGRSCSPATDNERIAALSERGVFIVSVDVESIIPLVYDYKCQEVITLLLELMERHEIHATWVVQGNILVDGYESSGENQLKSVSPVYRKLVSTELFVDNPGSWLNKALYKEKNIVQQIHNCKTSQEIGCHTFSHIRVGDTDCSREQFEVELKACQQIFDSYGVVLKSFVYPWNSIQYTDSLRKYGYIAYRSPSPDWYTRLPVFLQSFAYLVDHWLLIPSPVTAVSRETGIWNLPASYFYCCGAGWGKMIPILLRVNKVKKGLHLTARERQLFHLWFHPFNMFNNTKFWLRGLDRIFAEVKRCRDLGMLDNFTMGEVAMKLENSAPSK